MEHKLITVGISSNARINKEVIRRIGKITRTIAPLISDKNVNVISSEDEQASLASEMIRQILKSMHRMDMYNDLGSSNSIPYTGNSGDILRQDRWKKFVMQQMERFQIVIIVCHDNEEYKDKIRVNQGLDFPGLPLYAQPLELNQLN